MSTDEPRINCPLCSAPLPPVDGPVAWDDHGRAVAFRCCRRCQALVPAPVPGPSGTAGGRRGINGVADHEGHEELVDGTDSARRLIDEVTADAAAVAWEMAEHLAAPGAAEPIVDLGVARGRLPDALQRLGYRVKGCEPSPFLCQMARASYLLGPEVLANTDPDRYLTELEAEPTPLSAMVLWHVLDRHREPIELLRRCRRLLAGGLLFIEFPVVRPGGFLALQRFHPTPATLLHLADTLDLMLVGASLAEPGGLRAVYRTPEPGILDLDRGRGDGLDLAGLESAFRAIGPIQAHHVPDRNGSERPQAAEIGTST